MNKARVYIYLLVIVLVGVILRLVFYTGLYCVDDYKYANYAFEILHPQKACQEDIQLYRHYVETKHKFFIPPWKLNFGVYLPVAAAYKLFGIKEWTTILWPFLCSIGNILLAFYLARLIFKNTAVGLISSLLMTFFPLSVVFASRLTPDEISVFFIEFSCLAFLKSAESKYPLRWGILSGLALGLAYTVRCYMLIIVLFFFIYALSRRRIFRLSWPMALGFLVIFGSENILFFFLHYLKDIPFIFRLRVFQDIAIYYQKKVLQKDVYHLIMEFPKLMFDFKSVAVYYYYFIVAVWFLIIKKKWKETSIPLIWFGTVFFCLWFLPMDWRYYTLPVRDGRYLSITALPMILVIAYGLNRFISERKLILGYILAGLLAISSTASVSLRLYGPSSELNPRESFKIAAGLLKIISPRPLYCDIPTVSYKINYYHRFNSPFKIERSVTLTPQIRDVYVLIHDFRDNPPLDKAGIIKSIKKGEILGGRTEHLKGEEFDLSKWELLEVIKGKGGGAYLYLFYIPPVNS